MPGEQGAPEEYATDVVASYEATLEQQIRDQEVEHLAGGTLDERSDDDFYLDMENLENDGNERYDEDEDYGVASAMDYELPGQTDPDGLKG